MADTSKRGFASMSDQRQREIAREGGAAFHPGSRRDDGADHGGSRGRGFAAMDNDKQRQIASKGGRAAHQKGTAHEFTSQEARMAGRKGGETVSQDREHMAAIGRKGGETISQDREHMSRIGRKGGGR